MSSAAGGFRAALDEAGVGCTALAVCEGRAGTGNCDSTRGYLLHFCCLDWRGHEDGDGRDSARVHACVCVHTRCGARTRAEYDGRRGAEGRCGRKGRSIGLGGNRRDEWLECKEAG